MTYDEQVVSKVVKEVESEISQNHLLPNKILVSKKEFKHIQIAKVENPSANYAFGNRQYDCSRIVKTMY